MEVRVASGLIRGAVVQTEGPQQWADLGSGSGLFTYALSIELMEGSLVTAVDKNPSSLNEVKCAEGIQLIKVCSNLETYLFPPKSLNGIILANALHFVHDQERLLVQLKSFLRGDGRLVVVEYNLEKANPWVPFPVPFQGLEALGKRAGFSSCERMEAAKSKFQRAEIYSALLRA